jgi:hypothetical protein
MPDRTTDHRPVVTTIRARIRSHRPGVKLVSLKRQNFKAITREELEGALSSTDWTGVYAIRDVDDILEFITDGIISALNIVAPEKEIRVKKGPNLYLTRETLEAMKKRDADAGRRYRDLRNEVSRLVRRDKQDSNLLSLKKASNNPKVLWQLADQALGKDRPSLPASINGANGPTTTPMEASEVMNHFFIDKVLLSSLAGNVTNTTVEVDGSIIHPGNVIELLGVKYDRRLSTGPHSKALLEALRQRASVVSRLANQLPRGEYLRQLAYGLVIGKFSHALAAVARPRLEQEDNASVV